MPDTPKEIRNASMAALDDGWGDLLDAAPLPVAVVPKPVPTFADDDEPLASLPVDDDDAATDGVPLPTPVPLRTRVPTKPVLRGIRDESQPIEVLSIVRDVHEPSDGVPRAVDDGVPVATVELEPTPVPEASSSIAAVPTPVAAVPTPVAAVPTPVAMPTLVGAEPIVVPAPSPKPEPIARGPQPARALPTTAPRESSGRRTLLFGVSGVAALFVVGVFATRPKSDAADANARETLPAVASSAAAPAPAQPVEPIEPTPAAAPARAPDPVVEPAAAAPAAPAEPAALPPEPAAPTPETDAPAPSVAPPATPTGDPIADAQAALDAGEFARAHALARDAFKIDRDNEAMRIMATAACQLDDGVLARAAYRSLAGPRTRSEVFTLCRERGVDVRATTEGYTPRELLAKARRMADLGDPAQAYEIARDANRSKRSAAALELMGTCACKMKSADKAAYVAGLVGTEARQRIVDECTALGVELPPEG